jgi:hypothetical protein
MDPFKMIEYKQHEISKTYRPLSNEAYDNLKATIAKNPGEKPPVILLDGKILDGWHFYKACKELEIEAKFEALPSDQDPFEFINRRHYGRREMDSTDKAFAVDAQAKLKHGGNRGNQYTQNGKEPQGATAENLKDPSVEDLTKQIGSSRRQVSRVRYARDHGMPEILEAVKKKKITLKKAEALAHLPKDQQVEALKEELEPFDRIEKETNVAKAPVSEDDKRDQAIREMVHRMWDKALTGPISANRWDQHHVARIMIQWLKSWLREKDRMIQGLAPLNRKPVKIKMGKNGLHKVN